MNFTTSTKSDIQPPKKRFIFSLLPALFFGGLMILVKLFEVGSHLSLATYGLKPRVPVRLLSIFSFPFLHADWLHLFSNLLPFIFFSTLIFNMFPKIYWKSMLFTFTLSGFWTWCFARSGTVIGASGWVYALLGFLLVAGFSKVSQKTMVVAGGLAFLYGGMVAGLVPYKPNISWEGHLMGLFAGALAAVYWRKELKESETESSFKPKTDNYVHKEPPYPYWMYNGPHVLDAQRNVIHPDDLIWENGRPYVKPQEEAIPKNQQETESIPPIENPKPKGFNNGGWYISVS